MNWLQLTSATQLETIKAESHQQPVVIFKHSTTCSISRAVLDRLERNWSNAVPSTVKSYFLDLLTYRPISNQVASEFDVEHESPQVLVISQGKPIYHQSHFGIDVKSIVHALNTQVASKN